MRPQAWSVAVLPLSLWTLVTARLHHSLVPEDPHAFPKYRVAFLNGLPLLNETAHRWIQNGLRGGEIEFLDQPWEEDAQWRTPPVKSIEGGNHEQENVVTSEPDITPGYRLELMRMGPKASYLCFVPPPPLDNTSVPVEESDPSTDVTPVHSWSLLQPLSGSCLYHTQGWFTYAYCHNSHVRQFHELSRPGQQRLGDYKPEEDTEWEAYTLGRAPPTPEPGADLTVAQEAAIAANVELARNAGSRYLVQRWSDGTYCEKIGRKREIEIQFHCSMTMTDTILFVKETQTCHYVLHIATPRLCGEPGFRSRVDSHQETYIRCREIVSPKEYETIERDLPESDYPVKMMKRQNKPVIAPTPEGSDEHGQSQHTEPGEYDDDSHATFGDKIKEQLKAKENELIRRAFEKLMAGAELVDGELVVQDDEGDVVIGFLDLPEDGDEVAAAESLEEILRAAGYDIEGQKDGSSKDEERRKKAEGSPRRDEL